MADYTKVAAYDVRSMLWNELKNADLFSENDYYADGITSPLIPIIPAQQVPEFNNLLPGKTFIIYDVTQRATNVQWWMTQESMNFEVTSVSSSEIQTIINFMVDVFRRYDKSAKEANLQISTSSPFTFHFFRVDGTDPVQSFQTEGSLMAGTMTITYAYSREVDSSTGRYL